MSRSGSSACTIVQVALSANKGPDVVYSSGPSYAAAYASEGKLVNMNPYAKKYGWESKLLAPMDWPPSPKS